MDSLLKVEVRKGKAVDRTLEVKDRERSEG
jgi:hypothetical protein